MNDVNVIFFSQTGGWR